LLLAAHFRPLAFLPFAADALKIGERRFAALLGVLHGALDRGASLLGNLAREIRKNFAMLSGGLLNPIEGLLALSLRPFKTAGAHGAVNALHIPIVVLQSRFETSGISRFAPLFRVFHVRFVFLQPVFNFLQRHGPLRLRILLRLQTCGRERKEIENGCKSN
jgi:hypothetical protein